MRKFMLSAAAMTAVAALLASAPARADMGHGPLQNGNKCFKTSAGWGKDNIGYWDTCAQPASTAVAAKPQRVRRHAAR
jgi:hypothetical protein